MALNSVTIKTIVSSDHFQEECQNLLTFASEICEVPVVIFNYVENNTTTVIAKVENCKDFTTAEIQLISDTINFEKNTEYSKDSASKTQFEIAFEVEDFHANLCFYGLRPIEFTSIQLKTVHHVIQQIGSFFRLQIQNFELEQKAFYKKI